MKVAVIGAGSWGTALAQVVAKNNNQVLLWARKEEVVRGINENHANPRYLSDVALSKNIAATKSHEDALSGAQACVIVMPSSTLRETAQAIAPFVSDTLPIIICSKGVEAKTGMVGVEIFEDVLGNVSRLAALSGPNHAEEVILGTPSATVIASANEQTTQLFQELFATFSFRTYASTDVLGVELCAAFKNVIAIATGCAYGLGYGDNTAAMLQTRGLAEMSRLVTACGGQALTCMGLAGTGDMIVTCMSRHSRNRRLGEMIAQGKTLDDFTAETHMVAEGAVACKTLGELAAKVGVELPITDIVRRVVWEDFDPRLVSDRLLDRPLKPEFY